MKSNSSVSELDDAKKDTDWFATRGFKLYFLFKTAAQEVSIYRTKLKLCFKYASLMFQAFLSFNCKYGFDYLNLCFMIIS